MEQRYSRRDFIKSLSLGAGLLILPGISQGVKTDQHLPNILWLVSEDTPPWFGCYGDKFAHTPNLDRLAQKGIIYENAFANAPVCAPARSTLITGVYASSLGTQHMRSFQPIPGFIHCFTEYLRQKGYYCYNHFKTDYNFEKFPKLAWDKCGAEPDFKKLKSRQPFFVMLNFGATHEGKLHKSLPTKHDPQKIHLAPYHPDTPIFRHDYAQFYDLISKMDEQIGNTLKKLENEELSENTIIFYFSDHGGILPGSKRFLYDSGTRVPLIIYFPKKFQHLAPAPPGSRMKRLVSFVDFAPSILSLLGLEIPDYMQGSAFLGEQKTAPPEYVYLFRGRMDERYDMNRAIRDARFKYIRNFYPHFPRGRYISYLWKMPSMQEWERLYKEGKLNPLQSRFFQPKPPEELYDLKTDPYEINNLANHPQYQKVLEKMRKALKEKIFQIRDTGFLQEAEMSLRAQGSTPYEMARNPEKYPLEKIYSCAQLASRAKPENLSQLTSFLKNSDSAVRYWGAVGLCILGEKAQPAKELLYQCLKDSSPSVRIASAVALYKIGAYKKPAFDTLKKELTSSNLYVALYASDALEYIGEGNSPLVRQMRKAVRQRLMLQTLPRAVCL